MCTKMQIILIKTIFTGTLEIPNPEMRLLQQINALKLS